MPKTLTPVAKIEKWVKENQFEISSPDGSESEILIDVNKLLPFLQSLKEEERKNMMDNYDARVLYDYKSTTDYFTNNYTQEVTPDK